MPRTRSTVDRAALEAATLEQLQNYARKYRLPCSNDRYSLIEAILSSVERLGPTEMEVGAEEPRPESGASVAEEPLTAGTFRKALEKMTESLMRSQLEQQESFMRQQLEMQKQQQQLLLQLVQQVTSQARTVPAVGRNEIAQSNQGHTGEREEVEQAASSPGSVPVNGGSGRSSNSFALGEATKWLATQIPEFGGSDSENVSTWIRRVDRVAQIHGASDTVILLAASSKLIKQARRWYDMQDGPTMESWIILKREMIKIFERRLPFYKAMQKVEARKWMMSKETFDHYALAKLELMHSMDLPVQDTIHLIIGGISSGSLRATALSLGSRSMEDFLDKMRNIAECCAETDKKSTPVASASKAENKCRNCGSAGHFHKDCRSEVTCFYCKEKGHRQFDCPALKVKNQKSAAQQSKTVMTVAEVTDEEAEDEEVAFVTEMKDDEPVQPEPTIKVVSICGVSCNLVAVLDTGSPVSFIKYSAYNDLVKPFVDRLLPTKRKFVNLEGDPLRIVGVITVDLLLKPIEHNTFSVELFVLQDESFAGSLILGREFMRKEGLSMRYEAGKVNLFVDDTLPAKTVDTKRLFEKRRKK